MASRIGPDADRASGEKVGSPIPLPTKRKPIASDFLTGTPRHRTLAHASVLLEELS